MGCYTWLLSSFLCEYKSVRTIRIKHSYFGIIYYFIIFIVLLYVIIFTIIIEEGYQYSETAVGTTYVKIKGSASNSSIMNISDDNIVVYDSYDVVQPNLEQNAFFITTSYILTLDQTKTYCNGNYGQTPLCTYNNVTNCTINSFEDVGLLTGNCSDTGYCQYMGWCPPENPNNQRTLYNIGEFTAFIDIEIAFPKYDISMTNTLNKSNNNLPTSGYNFWTINEIIGNATNGELTYTDITHTGAIIYITSNWDCNLDRNTYCYPTFSFTRLDSNNNSISKGFNYRTIEYDVTQTSRSLLKLYGLRVVFDVTGEGKKFDLETLTTTFGAGLAYLGLATIITDFIVKSFGKRYKREKIDHAKEKLIDDDVIDNLVINGSISRSINTN